MLLFALLVIFTALAAGLAWFLVAHDHGEKEPIGMLWVAAVFGLTGAVAAAFLETHLLPVNDLLPGAPHGVLILSTLAVAIIEESCKFVPLAVLIYKKPYFNEHSDGIIYFALAGLGFGLPENLLYTLQFGAKTGLIRVVMTPFFHAATTGLVGYYLAKRKLAGRPVIGIVLPFSGVIMLHALYDFGLSSLSLWYAVGSLLITLGVTMGLFVAFLRATELDQDKGLSVVGNNSFCRSCGYPNPHHHLYCARCGKNA